MEIKPKQSLEQNRLIILFILEKSSIELTEFQLTKLTAKLSLLNYFDFKECIHELEELKTIYSISTPHAVKYKTTKKGSSIIESLYKEIRASQRMEILDYLKENKEEFIKESQFIGEVLRLKNDEFRVTLRIYEDYTTIFEVNVIVPSESMGYTLIKNWQNNATNIYKDVLLRLS